MTATPTAEQRLALGGQERGLPSPVVGQGPAEPAGPRFRLRVLRQRCIDCVGGPRLATRCDMRKCALWDYRTGHRPKGYKARQTPLKALRAYCLWCCLGSRQEARLCPATDCPLWPWRRGQSRTGDPIPPPAPERAPESRSAPRTGESETASLRNDLRCQFERRAAQVAALLGRTELVARPTKGQMPKVHTFTSMNCPHWYGGWCKRDGLPADPRERTDCPFQGWNAERGEFCLHPPCPKGVSLSGLGCSGCHVMQAEPCQWLEENMLPSAPETVVLDYAARTLGCVEPARRRATGS